MSLITQKDVCIKSALVNIYSNLLIFSINFFYQSSSFKIIDRKFSHYFISARVTQVYDAGACIYFYFGFNYGTMSTLEAVEVYEELETIARDEIIASGGSLSHHHGIGKIRKKWLPSVLTSNAISVLHSIKSTVDPQNIMAAGNLVFK